MPIATCFVAATLLILLARPLLHYPSQAPSNPQTVLDASIQRSSTPTPARKSIEEAVADNARVFATLEASGAVKPSSGPATRGKIVTIARKDIQLPADVFVEAYIGFGMGVPHLPCEYPLYVLRRGNSTIAVTVPSGIIYNERIVPGEEGAFNFLREVR